MNDIERFRFVTDSKDPDFIYLDNPSPMCLSDTQKWFEKVLGKDAVETYSLGGFFDGFSNSFKFKKDKINLFKQEILPELVKGDDGFFQRKESLAEANTI